MRFCIKTTYDFYTKPNYLILLSVTEQTALSIINLNITIIYINIIFKIVQLKNIVYKVRFLTDVVNFKNHYSQDI